MSGVSNVLGGQSISGMNAKSTGGGELTVTDFYKLLATQMKYQDSDNPMDTSEMMSQMVQTQMISAITQMSSINMTTYASSMVGKEATMAEIDEDGKYTGKYITGTITGVILGDSPLLYVDEKPYMLVQLVSVGKVPEKELGGDTDTDTDKDPDTDKNKNTLV